MILSKLRTFWKLAPPARLLAWEALVLPFLIRLAFALYGVPRTRALLSRWASPGLTHPQQHATGIIAQAIRIQTLVNRATGMGGTCLVRSLTLGTTLQRRGIHTDLRIGVRNVSGVMEGHAWLEYQGKPLNETEALTATYVRFDSAADSTSWRTLR